MSGTASAEVTAIRQLITNDSTIRGISDTGEASAFCIERELGHGHFGITYVGHDLRSRSLVAVKIELEDSGRLSTAVFDQIQQRIGVLAYFPRLRFFGKLAEVKPANEPARLPQVKIPSGKVNVKISTYELAQLTFRLPSQYRQLPPQIRVQMLSQLGLLPKESLTIEYRDASLSCTVMDFVRGVPLHEKQFSLVTSTFYIWQGAKGLCALHEKGIVHGDIKPDNIMVDVGGQIKVLDFTTARVLEAPFDPKVPRACSPYSPLSHFLTGKPSTTYSDVYGLGAVLYRLACGDEPARQAGSNKMEFYGGLSKIPEPWKSLLLRVFKANIEELQKPSGKIPFQARLVPPIDLALIGEPITSAAQLRDEIGLQVLENEAQRRSEWEDQRLEAEKQQATDRAARLARLLKSAGTLTNWDDLFDRELETQKSIEETFHQDWQEEHRLRRTIDDELGFSTSAADRQVWEKIERARQAAWQVSFAAWQQSALEQIEKKKVDTWNHVHEHEWDAEANHQYNWQRQRIQYLEKEDQCFSLAAFDQGKLRLERERREYWACELKEFRKRISVFESDGQQEFKRRKQALANMIAARKQECQRRKASTQPVAQAALLAWEKEWSDREQNSLAFLEPRQKDDERLGLQLRQKAKALEQQEAQRQASRSLADKLSNAVLTAGAGLSAWVGSFAVHLANNTDNLKLGAIILAIVMGCGFMAWRSIDAPNINAANQAADLGIQFHSLAELSNERNQQNDADEMYQAAAKQYATARKIYLRYFERYPNNTSETALMAHSNLAVVDWNAYLLFKKEKVAGGTLEQKIALLSEAEQHLSLYNAAEPSQENQERLLYYNIDLLSLTYDQAAPDDALRSLEKILNRLHQLDIELSYGTESGEALYAFAILICNQDLNALQQQRCDTILDQLK